MSKLKITLFGGFNAEFDQKTLLSFKSNKVRALLAYLAVESYRPHPRDSLADIFLSNQTDQKALANLRYTLYDLRKVLRDQESETPFLLISTQSIQFNPNSDYELDVQLFSQYVSNSISPHNASLIDEIYQGAFLEGFYIHDAPIFEEWISLERERLERQFVNYLQQISEYYQKVDDLSSTSRCIQRRLAIEPWNEEVHREQMMVLAKMGERSAALAQYERCCQLLKKDLGIEPSHQTKALYEEIQFTTREINNVSLGSSLGRPFFGRKSELSLLKEQLDRALHYQGRVIFVIGEAGIGKSALSEFFVRQALSSRSDLVAVISRCTPIGEIRETFSPFRELLELLSGFDIGNGQHIRDIPEYSDRLNRIAPLTMNTIEQVGSSLIDTFIPQRIVESTRAQGDNELSYHKNLILSSTNQKVLIKQFIRVMKKLAESNPLLLILDDFHFTDSSSLDLLFHFSQLIQDSRILIVIDMNSMLDNQLSEPFQKTVNLITRNFSIAPINLDKSSNRDFVDVLLDGQPNRFDDMFRNKVTRQTNGNALFVMDLLEELKQNGSIMLDDDGFWIEEKGIDWDQVPFRIETILADFYQTIPENFRKILQVASVEGEIFTLEVVAMVLEISQQKLYQDLNDIKKKYSQIIRSYGIIRPGVGNKVYSRFCFKHNLWRNYVYQNIDEIDRSLYHEKVGIALEFIYTGFHKEIALPLANHFEIAGLVDKAAEYLLSASQHAYLFAAEEDALQLLTQGLNLLKSLPSEPERDQLKIQLYLAMTGQIITRQGWLAKERLAALDRAYSLAQQSNSKPQFAKALFVLSATTRVQGNFERSLSLGKQLLSLSKNVDDASIKFLALYSIGQTLFFHGDMEESQRFLFDSLDVYNHTIHHELTAMIGVNGAVQALVWLSWIKFFLGFPDQSLEFSQQALALAEELYHPFSIALALGIGLICSLIHRGESSQIEPHIARLSELVDKYRIKILEPWLEIFMGVSFLTQGDLDGAIEKISFGISNWNELRDSPGLAFQQQLLIQTYIKKGVISHVREAVDDLFRIVDELGWMNYQAEAWRFKAILSEMEGYHDDVIREYLFRALSFAREQGAPFFALRSAVEIAKRESATSEDMNTLSEIYHSFTEGFDLPDLRSAKLLLNQFSQEKTNP